MLNCCAAVFVKRISRNLFAKRTLLTLTMNLNVRDITFTFETRRDRYGLGLDLSSPDIDVPGQLEGKFACRVRGLSG
jgi:hypothetical protein